MKRRMRVYGWDRCKLADAYTLDELNALYAETAARSTGREGIYLYDKKTRQRLDAVTWAIRNRTKMRDAGEVAA